jgi:hypothetical protein
MTGQRVFFCNNSNTSKLSTPSTIASAFPLAASGSANLASSVDTSVDTTFEITGTLADAADNMILRAAQFRAFYGA